MTKLSMNELTKLSLDELNSHLHNLGSAKYHAKRKHGIESAEYNDVVLYINLVNDVKHSLQNRGKTYYEFSESDIDVLTIEQLERFRKGISSKKSIFGNDPEVFDRCEELLDYSKTVLDAKRLEQKHSVVTKAELLTLLDNYRMNKNVDLLIASLEELAL